MLKLASASVAALLATGSVVQYVDASAEDSSRVGMVESAPIEEILQPGNVKQTKTHIVMSEGQLDCDQLCKEEISRAIEQYLDHNPVYSNLVSVTIIGFFSTSQRKVKVPSDVHCFKAHKIKPGSRNRTMGFRRSCEVDAMISELYPAFSEVLRDISVMPSASPGVSITFLWSEDYERYN